MDTSDEMERIARQERRVAGSEARSRRPQTWRARLRSLLRWLATTPPLLLVLLIAMDHLSSATVQPLGILLFALWASAALLWAAVEVLAGGDLRFRLTRLILIVAMLAVILGYLQVTVHQPHLAEQRCLASLKGLRGNVHWQPFGPAWLMRLAGQPPFQRVVQIELAGLEANEHQISSLHALPHLRCLFVTGPRFDDKVIDDLAALPALDQVWLTDSGVTASGVKRFRRARPNVQIERQGAIVDGPSGIPLSELLR